MRHESICDQTVIDLLDNVFHQYSYVPHQSLLVYIVIDILEEGVDLEFIRSVEIQCMEFSILAELVELRHEIVFDVFLEELLEFTRDECEVDLGSFEVLQYGIHVIFITHQQYKVFFGNIVCFKWHEFCKSPLNCATVLLLEEMQPFVDNLIESVIEHPLCF